MYEGEQGCGGPVCLFGYLTTKILIFVELFYIRV